eukprot:SAG31_NODE_4232_length_3436_cov_1.384477_5_plen_123_part_00
MVAQRPDGQRLATAFGYLTNVTDGGETRLVSAGATCRIHRPGYFPQAVTSLKNAADKIGFDNQTEGGQIAVVPQCDRWNQFEGAAQSSCSANGSQRREVVRDDVPFLRRTEIDVDRLLPQGF